MTDPADIKCTAFDGHKRIANGALPDVALAVKAAGEAGASEPVLVFDDATGKVIDLDLRGSDADIVSRLRLPSKPEEPRGRGRPKLGVIAREVTLLPRHWEWLSEQRGGASAALRRLIDEARRLDGSQSETRAAREAAYRFMSAIAGDLPGFEEAARALFAGNRGRFVEHISKWPADLRDYAERLAFGGMGSAGVSARP
jgi:uncharacterized protein